MAFSGSYTGGGVMDVAVRLVQEQVAELAGFGLARAMFDSVLLGLQSRETMRMREDEIEDRLLTEGNALLRQLLPSNQGGIERTFETIAGFAAAHGERKVALFGLAFKQGTDDLRESPFVTLAERLLGKGYDLAIFDRFVQVARLTGSNRAYISKEIPHLERLMVDAPAAALAGRRIVVVGHCAPEDRPALFDGLRGHTVLDLGGMPELRAIPGINYHGLCW